LILEEEGKTDRKAKGRKEEERGLRVFFFLFLI